MTVKPGKTMVTRIIVVMVALILSLSLVSSASLFNIMVIKGEKYQSYASEQQLYDSQYGGRNAVEEEPQEAPAQEQTQAVRSAESKEKADLDIHVKPMDMGQYLSLIHI